MQFTAAVLPAGLVDGIIAATKRDGGSSTSIDGRSFVGAPFFALSINPEHEVVVPAPLTAPVLHAYIAGRDEVWDDAHIIGTWEHEGSVYLDVVRLVEDRETAVLLARRAGQLAIFDLSTGTEISIEQAQEVAA